jgi:hypothetical protein
MHFVNGVYLYVLYCHLYGVFIDAVWIGNLVCWILVYVTRRYSSQFGVTHTHTHTLLSTFILHCRCSIAISNSRRSPSSRFRAVPLPPLKLWSSNSLAALHTLQITTAQANTSSRLKTNSLTNSATNYTDCLHISDSGWRPSHTNLRPFSTEWSPKLSLHTDEEGYICSSEIWQSQK